ncbi:MULTISPECIES: hypothetical protein [Bacillus]|uniref:hypothetical protein n=1 Tax=Bacillus TaxID=1386 RepID=UPI002111A48C|nr:hypothetical protein [Bacillus paranthracis]MCQ6524000.1 hypothetical protein [Bacillus paranthracis]MCU5229822.1 hypothetical protein [Bacillus paranthracis]MEC4604356.1 hypothetical protein [Bacillus paranthracis]
METILIHDLIKFGAYEHMKSFQEGKIFCRPLTYYQKAEEDILDLAKRYDEYEGVSELVQPKVLMRNNEKIELFSSEGEYIGDLTPGIQGPMKYYKGTSRSTPIFCMYSITSRHLKAYEKGINNILIDERIREFGKYLVIINDIEEFMDRIKKACVKVKQKQKVEVNVEGILIEYVDVNNYHGEYGIGKKPLEFTYQNEFRLVIDGIALPKDEAIIFDIGDISDISTLMSYTEFKNVFKVLKNNMGYNPFAPYKLQQPALTNKFPIQR